MFRKIVLTALAIVNLSIPSYAASDAKDPKEVHWSFNGFFGKVDKRAAQRGFQVYKEICSVCHSLNRLSYRNLEEIGFTKSEIKVVASNYSVMDGPNDNGDMFERPALPSDHFVPPFKNEKLARLSNNGALPPDLSLIVKARHDGPNHVYSILTGYGEQKPEHLVLMAGQHYNPYMAGGIISMAPPLSDEIVQYTDGTKATVDQMAKDVVNFLQWAAEPEMESRKKMGIKSMVYLAIFTVVFIIAKRRIWKDVR